MHLEFIINLASLRITFRYSSVQKWNITNQGGKKQVLTYLVCLVTYWNEGQESIMQAYNLIWFQHLIPTFPTTKAQSHEFMHSLSSIQKEVYLFHGQLDDHTRHRQNLKWIFPRLQPYIRASPFPQHMHRRDLPDLVVQSAGQLLWYGLIHSTLCTGAEQTWEVQLKDDGSYHQS